MAQVYYVKPDELYHYGILGMKWGVRRYQNSDGTLTAAGKKRYNRSEHLGSIGKKEQKRNETEKKDSAKNVVSYEKAKNDALKNAKEKDLWDMEFLEMVDNLAAEKWPHNIENDFILEDRNKDKLLELYKDYLDSDFYKTVYGFNHVNNNSDELYHYGILGMKWGIRRYQNPDGTLTAAGKKRYDKAAATMNELSGSKQKTDEKEKAKAASKPKTALELAKEMSDEELKAAVERIAREQKFAELSAKITPKEEHIFRDALKRGAAKGLEEGTSALAKKLIESAIKSVETAAKEQENKNK